jgi:hypothetical protein
MYRVGPLGPGLLLGIVVRASTLAACAASDAAPADSSEVHETAVNKFPVYAALAARHGVTPAAGRPLAIGIRGRDLTGKVHAAHVARVLDDTLAVLTPDQRVIELAVSTHPWETESTAVPDVDGDGHPDVGMIRPGTYQAVRRDASRNIAGQPTFHVVTRANDDRIPGWRNTDHDDAYSTEERTSSESRGDTLTAVLFHQIGDGAPAAVGCQVLDRDGIRSLSAVGGAGFDYLLVDATDEEALP